MKDINPKIHLIFMTLNLIAMSSIGFAIDKLIDGISKSYLIFGLSVFTISVTVTEVVVIVHLLAIRNENKKQ